LVKPATKLGVAALSLDHVVKDAERRTRGPIGSVHKGNGITGSLIELVNAEPFGRGQRGRSHVYVNKDRPGHLRRNGKPQKKTPGVTYIGELVLDDIRAFHPLTTLTLHAPSAEETTTELQPGGTDDDRAYKTVLEVIVAGKAANVGNVRAIAGMSHTRTSNALTRISTGPDRWLNETKGAHASKIYTPTGSHDQNST
jgi:hypothetical protein